MTSPHPGLVQSGKLQLSYSLLKINWYLMLINYGLTMYRYPIRFLWGDILRSSSLMINMPVEIPVSKYYETKRGYAAGFILFFWNYMYTTNSNYYSGKEIHGAKTPPAANRLINQSDCLMVHSCHIWKLLKHRA